MVRLYLTLLGLLFMLSEPAAQIEYYSIGNTGELYRINSKNCEEENLGSYMTMTDIAVTPNGKIYGINSRLYELDISRRITNPIGYVSNNYSAGSGEKGLLAINDSLLLADYDDSLILISTSNAHSYNIGYTGHRCLGDIAFLNDKLYMIDISNQLIEIALTSGYTGISSVRNIGTLQINSYDGYSLFSAFESCAKTTKKLYAIYQNKTYEVDPSTAALTEKCSFANRKYMSYGAASAYETDNGNTDILLPNVFSPNGDNLNDQFEINPDLDIHHFTVFNRWGNPVFESEENGHTWDGTGNNGQPMSDGVYYISVDLVCQYFKDMLSGTVTLFK